MLVSVPILWWDNQPTLSTYTHAYNAFVQRFDEGSPWTDAWEANIVAHRHGGYVFTCVCGVSTSTIMGTSQVHRPATPSSVGTVASFHPLVGSTRREGDHSYVNLRPLFDVHGSHAHVVSPCIACAHPPNLPTSYPYGVPPVTPAPTRLLPMVRFFHLTS